MKLSKGVKRVIEMLHCSGYRGYIVGGSLRDYYLGNDIEDYDVAASSTPEETLRVFKDYRVILDGMDMGTIKVIIGKEVIDVTTFRVENCYSDCRRPDEVAFIHDIEEDLKRRDFTINAMAYDLIENKLIDPYGGREDIKKGIIRAVGNPEERFREDCLRMIRAVRFMCRFDFFLDKSTEDAIKKSALLLTNLKAERLKNEIDRILATRYPHKAFHKMYQTGVLRVILPDLDRCFYHTIDCRGRQISIGEHCLTVLRNVRKYTDRVPVLMAALLHDSGIPFRKYIDDCNTSGEHNAKSIEITMRILERLRWSNKNKEHVLKLIKYLHERPGSKPCKRRIELKLLMAEMDKLMKDLIIFMFCHQMTGINDEVFIKEMKTFLKELDEIIVNEEPYLIKHLAVDGKDLTRAGYKGREVGENLRLLLRLVIDKPELNKKNILLEKAKP